MQQPDEYKMFDIPVTYTSTCRMNYDTIEFMKGHRYFVTGSTLDRNSFMQNVIGRMSVEKCTISTNAVREDYMSPLSCVDYIILHSHRIRTLVNLFGYANVTVKTFRSILLTGKEHGSYFDTLESISCLLESLGMPRATHLIHMRDLIHTDQRIVLLALALFDDSDILILSNPLGGLSSESQDFLHNFFKKSSRVLILDGDAEDIGRVPTKIIEVADGYFNVINKKYRTNRGSRGRGKRNRNEASRLIEPDYSVAAL